MAAAGYPKFASDFYDKFSTTNYFISRGASGNVYGPIRSHGLQLALKQVMLADGYVTDKVKKDIEEKKVIWTSLEHKNLMRIRSVDFSQLPKVIFIVMDFAAGGSLNKTLRLLGSENSLPNDVITNWAKQIAEGMLYLHEKNIVHRDLKSSNILLMKPFDVRTPRMMMTLKITDFDEVKEHDHTATMSLVGTVAYAAPEVLGNGHFSKASDIWSFGVVIWEMLSGDIPHKGLEPTTIIVKSQAGTLEKLHLKNSYPEDYKLILKRCWKSNWKKRLTFREIFCVLQLMVKGKDVTEMLKFKGNILEEHFRDTAKVSSKNFTIEPPLPLFTNEGTDDRESFRRTSRRTSGVEPTTSGPGVEHLLGVPKLPSGTAES